MYRRSVMANIVVGSEDPDVHPGDVVDDDGHVIGRIKH
jgi:hypothetical protein